MEYNENETVTMSLERYRNMLDELQSIQEKDSDLDKIHECIKVKREKIIYLPGDKVQVLVDIDNILKILGYNFQNMEVKIENNNMEGSK